MFVSAVLQYYAVIKAGHYGTALYADTFENTL